MTLPHLAPAIRYYASILLPVVYGISANYIGAMVSGSSYIPALVVVILAGLTLFTFLRVHWNIIPLDIKRLHGWTFLPVYPLVGICMFLAGQGFTTDRPDTVWLTFNTVWPFGYFGTFILAMLNIQQQDKSE